MFKEFLNKLAQDKEKAYNQIDFFLEDVLEMSEELMASEGFESFSGKFTQSPGYKRLLGFEIDIDPPEYSDIEKAIKYKFGDSSDITFGESDYYRVYSEQLFTDLLGDYDSTDGFVGIKVQDLDPEVDQEKAAEVLIRVLKSGEYDSELVPVFEDLFPDGEIDLKSFTSDTDLYLVLKTAGVLDSVVSEIAKEGVVLKKLSKLEDLKEAIDNSLASINDPQFWVDWVDTEELVSEEKEDTVKASVERVFDGKDPLRVKVKSSDVGVSLSELESDYSEGYSDDSSLRVFLSGRDPYYVVIDGNIYPVGDKEGTAPDLQRDNPDYGTVFYRIEGNSELLLLRDVHEGSYSIYDSSGLNLGDFLFCPSDLEERFDIARDVYQFDFQDSTLIVSEEVLVELSGTGTVDHYALKRINGDIYIGYLSRYADSGWFLFPYPDGGFLKEDFPDSFLEEVLAFVSGQVGNEDNTVEAKVKASYPREVTESFARALKEEKPEWFEEIVSRIRAERSMDNIHFKDKEISDYFVGQKVLGLYQVGLLDSLVSFDKELESFVSDKLPSMPNVEGSQVEFGMEGSPAGSEYTPKDYAEMLEERFLNSFGDMGDYTPEVYFTLESWEYPSIVFAVTEEVSDPDQLQQRFDWLTTAGVEYLKENGYRGNLYIGDHGITI